MQRHYHLWSIGCQMNMADARTLAARLEALGYAPCQKPEQADVLVLNTCVIRQQAEDKITSMLRHLRPYKAKRPNMTLAVMGCMVGKRELPKLQEQFPFVDLFLPPSEPDLLLDLLQRHELDAAAGALAKTRTTDDEWPVLPASAHGRAITAHVPVVFGCSHACSFCVIPSRRGVERSRPRESILNEVRRLAEEGVREVTLLGQIVDRYGLDLGGSYELADLLLDVAHIKSLARVRFLTSHPNWVNDRLLDVVAANKKICPYIELPVQSGNDEILKHMRRGYTAQQFRDLVARVRARLPNAGINTDVIVGFPGETEAQFMDTYQLLEELRLDAIHNAQYSERPGTPAARKLPDDAPATEKERRWQMVEDLGKRILGE
ncbi:MAG: MiaB/RimO family radical SAM methylthiotransferase, partial [Kiritimatiellaeota bacterium]|nr:MiaB/RimO family radical SAM methylthiotransferase [Kiritimatiellota bacterium]